MDEGRHPRRALDKLGKFTPKIGYPDTWRDYSALRIDPADLLANVRAAHAFEFHRELGKIGKPLDRDEWFMTPQTINAYYNPGMNEIVFPAAILQYPFFDPGRDAAANYGAIGAVIGHEIGHGFDDQGSQYDGDGRLTDWWTEADRQAFEKRTQSLIAQYDALAPKQAPDHHVNGALTIGENIGDLGGLAIAWKAYLLSLDGEEPPVIDGLTGAAALLPVLGAGLAAQGPRRGSHPAALDRPALAERVPLQPDRAEHRRVLRRVRCRRRPTRCGSTPQRGSASGSHCHAGRRRLPPGRGLAGRERVSDVRLALRGG